jgi:hypothetical protein
VGEAQPRNFNEQTRWLKRAGTADIETGRRKTGSSGFIVPFRKNLSGIQVYDSVPMTRHFPQRRPISACT